MFRQVALGSLAVFVAWSIFDCVVHGVVLGPTYAMQPELFRPQAEMRLGLIYVAVAVPAISFCWIYAALVSPKSLRTPVQFGALWGIAAGIGMGYGTYDVMPIRDHVALGWFLGTVVEAIVAGALVGAIAKDRGRGRSAAVPS